MDLSELSECMVQLPAFIDSNHKVSHSLSPRGVSVCERIISLISFNHPAITYAPALYGLTSLLLHYMEGLWYLMLLITFTSIDVWTIGVEIFLW